MSIFKKSLSSGEKNTENDLEVCFKLLQHEPSDEPWWKMKNCGKKHIKKAKYNWRCFLSSYLRCIRAIIIENIKKHNSDNSSLTQGGGEVWQDLYARLCDSTRLGKCVSFESSEERFAYLLNFFECRSAYMANMMAVAEKGMPVILN